MDPKGLAGRTGRMREGEPSPPRENYATGLAPSPEKNEFFT